jgi:hypothetical protein
VSPSSEKPTAPAAGDRRRQPAQRLHVIQRRRGVRHGADRGEAALGGGGGAGGDRLLVVLAWLAQVDVDIDQAGRDDQPAGVDGLARSIALAGRRDRRHPPVPDDQVGNAIDPIRRVDQAPAGDRRYPAHAALPLPARCVAAASPTTPSCEGHKKAFEPDDSKATGDAMGDRTVDQGGCTRTSPDQPHATAGQERSIPAGPARVNGTAFPIDQPVTHV